MADPYADIASPDPYADIASHADASAPLSGNALSGAARALEANLPFVDRAVAAAKSALPQGYGGTGQDYAANLAAERSKNEQFAEQNPWTNAVGGLVASAPLAAVPGVGEGSLGARVASMGAIGAGAGAVQGISSSPDLTNLPSTGADAAIGATAGGALGAAAPVAAFGVGKAISPLAAALRSAPDASGLGNDVAAAYQRVKDLGASYSPQSYQALVDKIAADAEEQRIGNVHPGASSVIAGMQKTAAQGRPVDLTTLDQDRQIAWRDAASKALGANPNMGEAHFGNMIRGNIDKFLDEATPQAMEPAAPQSHGLVSFGPAWKDRFTAESLTGEGAPDYVPPGSPEPAPAPPKLVRPVNPNIPAPRSLVSFLSNYGLRDEGGDLASMGYDKFPGLIRKQNGVPMDEGVRLATEAGYLPEDSAVNDLLDKMGEHPTYAMGDENEVGLRENYSKAMEDYRQARDEARPSQLLAERADEVAPSVAPTAVPPAPSNQDAAAAIKTARDLAMRQFKAKALAEALDRAQVRTDVSGTGGNIENATRQRLAAILPKEPWSQDEAAQLSAMIHGTPVTNSLRSVSRLSPVGNALTTMLEGGGAYLSGSPAPLVAAGAGILAQGAGALARRNAQRQLLATILAGGKAPVAPSYAPPNRAALAAALAGGQQLPRRESTPQ